jgi:hypothetical protein
LDDWHQLVVQRSSTITLQWMDGWMQFLVKLLLDHVDDGLAIINITNSQ